MRGLLASALGALVVACSGCGGGGGDNTPAASIAVPVSGSQVVSAAATPYPDGRPTAAYRLNATDAGVVLKHGDPQDALGARDVFVYQSGSTYYMNYDGATSAGWLTALATSTDLTHWQKVGTVLPLGAPGEPDAGSASYGTTYFDGSTWHMFYLGTPNATPAPYDVPSFPYLTMKAKSTSPSGPWVKEYNVTPFHTTDGTYYSRAASPGQIVNDSGTYLQFFSASTLSGQMNVRTIGIARTANLDSAWQVDPAPVVPLTEQIENASLYYQDSDKTWFMFTDHVGINAAGVEYTDAIWMYWTKDLNHWNASQKAVVLDASNCSWSHQIIGLPSVMPINGKLAILYDGQAAAPQSTDFILLHVNRDVGLAWLNLPIRTP